MGVRMGWLLVFVVAGGGVAHASGRQENWKAVEKLAKGASLIVEEKQGAPEDCRLVAVDDAALTCDREPDPNVDWGPGAKARVVFPRDAVKEVRVWAPKPNWHIELWIAGGVGFALGGAVCAVGGPGVIVECGALGALLVAALIESAESGPRYPWVWSPWPAPMPPSYPARPREMRQKLVYRAPALAGGAVSH